MKDKITKRTEITAEENRVLEQMRRHPEIAKRMQEILALTDSADGPLKTADEIEELLIEELRKLGNTAMNGWAAVAEERVSQQLKEQDPSVRARKKKR
jgi:phosphoribosyl-dephospho-CoA transferase